MALTSMAAEIERGHLWNRAHNIVLQGPAGLFGLRCGEWEGRDARQKLHYPEGCACVGGGHPSNDDPGQSRYVARRWRPDFR